MCTDKLKILPCNKDKTDVELADFSQVTKKTVILSTDHDN